MLLARRAIDVAEENFDGAVPCGPCQRAHAYEVRVRPSTAPTEPSCNYDHPDLISEGPKARVVHLESEIAKLRELLEAADAKLACCTCGAAATAPHNILTPGASSEVISGDSHHSSSSATPQLDVAAYSQHGGFVVSTPAANLAYSSGTFLLPNSLTITDIPSIPIISTFHSTSFVARGIDSVPFDVVPSAWPPNLPPPVVLFHLVDTFFASVPLASRLIHKPTFMVALRQLPTSPDFPHIGLLHAICALASLYSPIIADPKLDKARWNAAGGFFDPDIHGPLDPADGEEKRFPKTFYDLRGTWGEGFGVTHVRLASLCLRISLRDGDRLLQLVQGSIICAWYAYSMGMTMGVYVWTSAVTKLVGPLGIYVSEEFEPLSRLPSNMLFLVGKPATPVEAETIRNTFWIAYVMERVYNAGTVWPLTLSDGDISQMLPCRSSDFTNGEYVPTHNRQRIFTENMLLNHPTLTTDSWTLYIKASILVSKVRSFNSRYWIVAASKGSGAPNTSHGSPKESEGFRHLDQMIVSFTASIPRAFRDPVEPTVDPLLYMVHLLPHMAMIQLHDPHARPDSPNDHSAMQMLAATRSILDLMYKLCGTAYDLLHMDHSCSFGWFLAGAAIIRFLKAKINAKDEEEVMRLEQELGIVKFMLRNLGDRTIIGYRQINVLEDLYNVEIKGHGRKAPTAPSATDQRAETDNLMFGNMQPAIDAEGESFDGSLPCEPCQRAHAYEVKTRPATAPDEPACEYDHPDIVAEGPKGRIGRLESQIAELQALLEVANGKLSRCSCGASSDSSASLSLSGGPSTSSYDTNRTLPSSTTLGPSGAQTPTTSNITSCGPSAAVHVPDSMTSVPPPIEAFLLPPSPWNVSGPPPAPYLPFYPIPTSAEALNSTTFDVCPASWPLNIPPPLVLHHLVEIFFNSVPLASRLIHKPSFMLGLRQVPTSPEFPHVALLHAICGLASLYSPIITDPRNDPAWAHFPSGSFNSAIIFRPNAGEGVQGKHYFPKSLQDIMDIGEEGFGAAHIRWAAASLRLSVREGDRLLQLLQAAIVCTWYTYSMGMTIAVYSWMGSVTRIVGPLGVYASEGFEPLSRLPFNMLFLSGNPRNPIEAETIRNAFWVTYVMERIYNAGTAWPLTITDEDISQMMPCRFSDFVAGERVPTHGRQRLFTENMLLTHPPLTTDSWTLYIKATILISRVRSFNCRYRILAASTGNVVLESSSERTEVSPTESEEFGHLDQTIAAFVRDMPRAYRDPVGTTVDPLLYMAHLLPHVAMIQLHDPHAQLCSPNDYSTMQMLTATRAIMDLIYKVCGTTYDLLYMDHGCSFGWFVAGAAVIRFLKVKMDAKDADEVARLEQELGAVKFMLKNLGERTIIGLRQIKLLEDIYNVEEDISAERENFDGSLPCEQCRRAHAYEVKTRPVTAPAEPTCEYDHPDLVAEGSKGRIARLEARIAELQASLEAANQRLTLCTCGAFSHVPSLFSLSGGVPSSSGHDAEPISSAVVPSPLQDHPTPATSLETLPAPNPINSVAPPIVAFLLAPSPWNLSSPPSVPSILLNSTPILNDDIDSTTFDVCPFSWPLNIPPPMVLYHLVDVFFNSVPLASRLIHKPTFMVRLRQVPTSPEFPHVALLHAICGIAALYSPITYDPNVKWETSDDDGEPFYPTMIFRPNASGGIQGKYYLPRTLDDIIDTGEEGFGAAHIRWAAASMRLAAREGDRLLQLLQAAIICTWFSYSTGMNLAVYTWIGTVTRLLGPIGIHISEGFEPLSRLPFNMLFLFGNPKDHVEAETIRNVFWIAYVMERIYNGGTTWPLTITDETISQMLPCRFSDFVAGVQVPTHGRQRIFTENMLLTHPFLTTDSWTLYIKATILISRVRSFNSHYRMPKAPTGGVTSEPDTERATVSPTESDEFRHLDQTILAFLRDMPRGYRNPVGTTVDPLLYMAHMLPHVAMIQLHDPHAQLHSPNDYSAMQLLTATRAIMDLIYKLCGTAYDPLYLDHGCSFCWFVAGAALIRFLKAKMDAGDEDEVARLEQELAAVKFMLKNLGDKTGIGPSQIMLLDEIYKVEVKG